MNNNNMASLILKRSVSYSTPFLGLYFAYKYISRPFLLHCAPIHPSDSKAREEPPIMPYIFPPDMQSIASSFVKVNKKRNRNDDDDVTDDEEQRTAETMAWISSNMRQIISTITRTTIYLLPESVQAKITASPEQNLVSLSIGALGLVSGMSIKRRFNSIVVFGTLLVFGTRLCVEFGFITINWDRIYEFRRRFPIIGEVIALFPQITNSFLSLPMAGFFSAGFLLGFRFG